MIKEMGMVRYDCNNYLIRLGYRDKRRRVKESKKRIFYV